MRQKEQRRSKSNSKKGGGKKHKQPKIGKKSKPMPPAWAVKRAKRINKEKDRAAEEKRAERAFHNQLASPEPIAGAVKGEASLATGLQAELHSALVRLSKKLIALKQNTVNVGNWRDQKHVNALDRWAAGRGMSKGEARSTLANAHHFGVSGAEGALEGISVFQGKNTGEKLALVEELIDSAANALDSGQGKGDGRDSAESLIRSVDAERRREKQLKQNIHEQKMKIIDNLSQFPHIDEFDAKESGFREFIAKALEISYRETEEIAEAVSSRKCSWPLDTLANRIELSFLEDQSLEDQVSTLRKLNSALTQFRTEYGGQWNYAEEGCLGRYGYSAPMGSYYSPRKRSRGYDFGWGRGEGF